MIAAADLAGERQQHQIRLTTETNRASGPVRDVPLVDGGGVLEVEGELSVSALSPVLCLNRTGKGEEGSREKAWEE